MNGEHGEVEFGFEGNSAVQPTPQRALAPSRTTTVRCIVSCIDAYVVINYVVLLIIITVVQVQRLVPTRDHVMLYKKIESENDPQACCSLRSNLQLS